MFNNFGFGELAVLVLLGLIVFGPDKLPKAAMDTARVIKRLRAMADDAVHDFKSELPPEMADLDLRSLHPRRIIQDAVFNNESAATPAKAGPKDIAENRPSAEDA
jgi:sec-independent protein translocase protein TatB